jgi:hypothetical protein
MRELSMSVRSGMPKIHGPSRSVRLVYLGRPGPEWVGPPTLAAGTADGLARSPLGSCARFDRSPSIEAESAVADDGARGEAPHTLRCRRAFET